MDSYDSGYPTLSAERLAGLAREVADSSPASLGEEIAPIVPEQTTEYSIQAD